MKPICIGSNRGKPWLKGVKMTSKRSIMDIASTLAHPKTTTNNSDHLIRHIILQQHETICEQDERMKRQEL